MQPNQYTPEQQVDIKERVERGLKLLKELNLHPAAMLQKVNMGEDVFADKVICYLKDEKYQPIASPYNESLEKG